MQPTGRGPLIATRRGHTTTTSLTARPSPALAGRLVTLTAHVVASNAAANPASGGIVHFYRGAELLDSVPLQMGVAKLATTNLPSGKHSIAAVYQGDGILHSSTSPHADLVVEDAPGGVSGTFSMVVVPEFGHLVTLESRSDGLPPSLHSLAAKLIDVPTSLEESIRLRPSAWQFAPNQRSQLLLASTDVDEEGLREPLLEVRDASWMPVEVFQQVGDDPAGEEFPAEVAEVESVEVSGGYTGGVGVTGERVFVPNREMQRIEAGHVLPPSALQSREAMESIPVIAAGRSGKLIRIFGLESATENDDALTPPPTPMQEPEIEDEGFESIFVG